MDKIVLSVKSIGFLLLNLVVPSTFLQIEGVVNPAKQPPESIFWIYIAMMFIPELLFAFVKGFRNWMRSGLEDGDGVLDKADMKDLIQHYTALTSLRLFMLFGLLIAIYNVDISYEIYITPFFGAMGIEGAVLARNIARYKKA